MALFRKPSAYLEANGESTAGAAVAVAEAEAEAEAPMPAMADTPFGKPLDHPEGFSGTPFAARLTELEAQHARLYQLELEAQALASKRHEAIHKARAQEEFLTRLETPSGLLEVSDAALEEHKAQWRHLLREQARAEQAHEAFTAAHPDLQAQRERLNRERGEVAHRVTMWRFVQDYAEIAQGLEPWLMRLLIWQKRREAYLREHPEPWAWPAGLNFDTGTMPLEAGILARDFKFWRVAMGLEQDEAIERVIERVKSGTGAWPSLLKLRRE